jgi:hypothetical protein
VTTHGIKFVAWEDETTSEICEAGDCSRGDAQGLIEACPVLVARCYAAGFTPFEAAKFILQETAS